MKAEELRFNGSKWELRKRINDLESELEKVSAENRLTASRLKLALRAMNEFKHDLAHQILANAVEDLTQKN